MPGLMEPHQPQQQPDEEAVNVSPEEQSAYNQFVANGHIAIYSDVSFPRILESLKGNKPAEALANTAATVVKQLQASAEKQGKQINPDVLMQGGKELFEELADLQVTAQIADLPQDQLEGAWYRALDLYRTMSEADGTLHKEALQQDMNAMVQADQQGQLEQMLPGVSQGQMKGAM